MVKTLNVAYAIFVKHWFRKSLLYIALNNRFGYCTWGKDTRLYYRNLYNVSLSWNYRSGQNVLHHNDLTNGLQSTSFETSGTYLYGKSPKIFNFFD